MVDASIVHVSSQHESIDIRVQRNGALNKLEATHICIAMNANIS